MRIAYLILTLSLLTPHLTNDYLNPKCRQTIAENPDGDMGEIIFSFVLTGNYQYYQNELLVVYQKKVIVYSGSDGSSSVLALYPLTLDGSEVAAATMIGQNIVVL